jgi:tetratricopeptide (TPR) repeat protein
MGRRFAIDQLTRSSRRAIGGLAVAAAIACTAAFTSGAPSIAGLDTLSPDERTQLAALKSQADDSPNDPARVAAFARLAVALGRREDDGRLFTMAAAALEPWRTASDVPADLLVVRATMRQFGHDFEPALTDLDRAIEARPRDAQALLSRAFVLAVLGRHQQAYESCHQLPLRTPLLLRVTCLARAASLAGRAAPALARLRSALDLPGEANSGQRRFGLVVAADIAARLGETAMAEAMLQEALKIEPRDVFLRAAYAELLIERGRLVEARDLIGEAPTNVHLLLLRALASGGPGDEAGAAAIAQLRSELERDRASRTVFHAREHARFALDVLHEPALALDLALANWRLQKEPIDALVLLRSAESAKRPEAAAEAMAWVCAAGMEDVRLAAALAKTGACPGQRG